MVDTKPGLLERASIVGFDIAEKKFCKLDAIGAEKLGQRFGELAYVLDKKHRLRTISNLALAFPEKSEAERLRLAKEVFRHFGRVLGDFLRSPMRTHEEVLANVEITGWNYFEQAKAMNSGILVSTAHLGNWERFAQLVAANGEHMAVVARDANQGLLQARVMRIREAQGIDVLSRGLAARDILKRLKNKEFIGILADQNDDEAFVKFFGKPCGTVLGPAVLHQRTKAPLLPAYLVRTGPGKYRAILLPLVDPDNVEEDRERLMQMLNDALESVIREFPEQWLWMHDRWKSARLKGLMA